VSTTNTDISDRIRAFLARGPFAVVGASGDRCKYGNKVLRAYRQRNLPVFPVNPRETEVEGLPCYPALADLPQPVRAVSIVTPPAVTERIVEEAAQSNVQYLWIQPGAESQEALRRTEELGLLTIAGGPCLLATLGYREE
jgi:predicted CoA-binding protein